MKLSLNVFQSVRGPIPMPAEIASPSVKTGSVRGSPSFVSQVTEVYNSRTPHLKMTVTWRSLADICCFPADNGADLGRTARAVNHIRCHKSHFLLTSTRWSPFILITGHLFAKIKLKEISWVPCDIFKGEISFFSAFRI